MRESHNPHAAMEAGGAYNKHAALQASAGALAAPVLQIAASDIRLSDSLEPFIIADYGSSQGKNSFVPLRAAINSLRARASADRPILVIHIDQPTNDFNELFRALNEEPDSYLRDNVNVFHATVGKSFYESVLPREFVDLGWSSYAAQWLSRAPLLIPGHIHARCSSGAVWMAFENQAAEDWKTFLALRARELRPGGRLVVVLPGVDDDGSFPLIRLFDEANNALGEMVIDGVITADQRAHMVLSAYPRRRQDLLAPFTDGASFEGLTVQHCELSNLHDIGWEDFQSTGDSDAWAGKHARFFRSTFVPSLASVLRSDFTTTDHVRFADDLEARLRLHLAQKAAPIQTFVQTLVLAKA